MPIDPRYLDALRRLVQPIRAADLPHTLAPMQALLAALDQPHAAYPSIVVAGSVGKGTTCWKLATLLRAAGLKVGLYTSPHLHLFRERMQILLPDRLRVGQENISPVNSAVRTPPAPASNPQSDLADTVMISPAEFVEGEAAVRAAAGDHRYSTFEAATALALWWFNRCRVDVAVLEVGLGGRFDAVNAVPNALAVITPLEAEHLAMLGGTLESVAWHKAGIIQPGGVAITCPQPAPLMAILEQEAAAKGARLVVVEDGDDLGKVVVAALTPPPSPLTEFREGESVPDTSAFPGNAPSRASSVSGAVQLAEAGFPSIAGGFEPPASMISPPARLESLQRFGRSVIIDGAHTPSAARRLKAYIDDRTAEPCCVIAGMLRDKAVGETLRPFDLPGYRLILTTAPGDRALPADELFERAALTQAEVEVIPALEKALGRAQTCPERTVIVTGSLRMAAAAREAYGLLTPDELEEARATRAIFEGAEYRRRLTAF